MDGFVANTEDPMAEFENWFQQALACDNFEPTAVALCSVDRDGMPSSRMVLLKVFDSRGFCFFTNYESTKARQMMDHPKACLCFHWQKPVHRQVRVQGMVEKTQTRESEDYFKTRLRGSQVGAWASPQSQVIQDRRELEERILEMESRFSGVSVPCPPHWGGFRLKPLTIEFWQTQEFRLHDRLRFARKDLQSPWKAHRLAP